MKLSLALVAFAAVSALSFQVSAATYDFTAQGGSNISVAGFSDTVDGVGFTATFLAGVDPVDGTGGVARNGRIGAAGLGANRLTDNSTGPFEAILLTFDESVILNSLSLVEFPNLGAPGVQTPVSVFIDGATTAATSFNVAPAGAGGTTEVFNSIVDTVLIVNTDGFGGANLQFRLAQIDVSQVPLPAAAWLFGSVLAAAGIARRVKPRS